MAAPTIVYDSAVAASGSSLHASVFSALHDLLTDAGWTQEYIDSDAVGGGSSGSPAWDKTPANNTATGRAIYSMPLNDHSRAWFVEFTPSWGATAANNLVWTIRIGTGIDGGNDLIDPGSTLSVGTNNVAATASAMQMSASEDGFFVSVNHGSANISRVFWVERVRDIDGVVGDDLFVSAMASATTNAAWPGSLSPNSTAGPPLLRYRASDGLESATRLMLLLNAGASTTGGSGETNIPQGPIPTIPSIGGYPRLFLFLPTADATFNTDHPVLVDGGVKQYRTATTALNVSAGVGTLIVATE